MRHLTKKVKFHDGQDSDTSIMKKLMYNFLRNAHITTTERKAKVLKMYMDRAISKTKEKTEANKNYLLSYFPDSKIIKVLFEQVGPAIAKINGGFVKTTRINQRQTDGALMVKVQWAHPVVIDWGDKKKEVKATKAAAKTPAEKEAKPDKSEVKKVTKEK